MYHFSKMVIKGNIIMKKYPNLWLSLLLLVSAIVLTNCTPNHSEIDQEKTFGKKVAQDEGTDFEYAKVNDRNQSDIQFTEAENAYAHDRINDVKKHLNEGIKALLKEGQSLKGEPRQRLMQAVNHIETIALEIGNRKFGDIRKLQDVVSAAELTVAHEYAVDLEEYSVLAPLPDSYFPRYKAALRALQGAEKRLHGMAKSEAQVLIRDSNALLEKIDQGENISDREVRDQKAKLDVFFNTYQHFIYLKK
jgi:hypothetical protein